MGKLFRLDEFRHQNTFVRFDRNELAQLLDIYSRQVASGIWRDYAIDTGAGMAMFSVYRHTHEAPLFSVVKLAAGSRRQGPYVALQGGRTLKHCQTLDDALHAIEKKLRKVIPLFS